jgi:hypothetical protein
MFQKKTLDRGFLKTVDSHTRGIHKVGEVMALSPQMANGNGRNAMPSEPEAATLESKLRTFYSLYVPPGAPLPDPAMVVQHYKSPMALNGALKKKYGANLDDLNDEKAHASQDLNGIGPTPAVVNGLGGPTPAVVQQEGAGSNRARKSGWMYKRGWANSAYKRRWFVMEKGQMSWHANRISDDSDTWGTVDGAKGTISCLGAHIEPDTGVHDTYFCFALTAAEGTTTRRMELACESVEDRESWVSALRRYDAQCIRQCTRCMDRSSEGSCRHPRGTQTANLTRACNHKYAAFCSRAGLRSPTSANMH